MQTLTAIIRAKPGCEDTVLTALNEVGVFARDHEPDTLGFFVAQDPSDPCVFTTYERFTDAGAMDRHNNGAGSKGFFAATNGMLDGAVTIVIAQEVFSL
jgi:quinol monooxygenase YgiN